MRTFLIILIAVLTITSPAFAQQAGDNNNVLPVVIPFDGDGDGQPDDPDWFLKGDGYLQRQVEPTIAASTRNPDHLVAFFNDYRAVDISDDVGLGGDGETIAATLKAAQLLFAAIPSFQLPRLDLPFIVEASAMAAAEAWVGMSRSYDGGLTWSGGFVPGGPFDTSAASLESPIYGLEAATDPVTVCGPCGQFYTAFVAFTRGGESKLVVARYEDLNNDPGGDTIVYRGMTVIETGDATKAKYSETLGDETDLEIGLDKDPSGGEKGLSDKGGKRYYFIDKPSINIDVWRGGGSNDDCAHRLYVAYTGFKKKPGPTSFKSELMVAVSEDGAQSFKKKRLNRQFKQNQGSVIAIDPREGTPNTTGGGTVYTIWRHFNSPDTILVSKSTTYGKTWDKPKKIIGSPAMATFDQKTISTETAIEFDLFGDSGLPEVAFRSNAFPTATVATNAAGNATVFAAWQERVGNDGYPLEGGSPRIVMVRSDDNGKNWTDIDGVPNQRKAVDMGARDAAGGPEPGFGTLPQPRLAGPQVMPALSFAAGKLLLVHSEARGRIINYGEPENEFLAPDVNVSPITGFISGYDLVMDFRAALLDPATGGLLGSSQISRYSLWAGADLSNGEDYQDVAPVNPPCSPDYGDGLRPCIRQVNRVNAPHSAAGTSPFIGDYPGAHPFVQFVTDEDGNWRWATEPDDLPSRGFHTVWADNRHVVPPQPPEGASAKNGFVEWAEYPNYDAPGTGETSCANPGSRNTDVLTARVDAELILNAPATYKNIGSNGGSFPFTLSNKTSATRTYQLNVDPNDGTASLLPKETVVAADVTIFPFSSTSQAVYLSGPFSDPVTVTVEETTPGCTPECQSGSIAFNLDETLVSDEPPVAQEFYKPEVKADAFVINYNLENAFVINEGGENAFVINPTPNNAFVINEGEENAFVINAFVINAFVINAFVINAGEEGKNTGDPEYYDIYNIIDTTWAVGPGESTDPSSFLPIINIDKADELLDNYVFQLIVHKGSQYGTLTLDGCEPTNVNQTQVLSTFAQGPGTEPENAFVINPTPKNAFVINEGFPGNAFVINSTFAVAPTDQATGGAKSDDGTLKAPRAQDEIFVTVRAYQIKPTEEIIADGEELYNPFPANDPQNPLCQLAKSTTCPAGDPPSIGVASLDCDTEDPESECFDSSAPDLVPTDVDDTELAGIVGESFTFPAWTLLNQGTADGNAENDDLRHAFYLCDPSVVAEAADDEPLDVSECLLFDGEGELLFTTGNTLPPAGTDPFAATTLSLPAETIPGAYDVVLYVDDLFQVSEINEVNNYAAVPIEIVGELIDNGNFESPVVSGGFELFTEDQIDDWSFDWAPGCSECSGPAYLEIQSSGTVIQAREGSQLVELDSDTPGGSGTPATLSLSTDLESCDGADYVLKYSWAKRTPADVMTVGLNDEPVFATHGDNEEPTLVWTDETWEFTGDGSTITITFTEIGPADSLGMLLDAVSLVGPVCPAPPVVE